MNLAIRNLLQEKLRFCLTSVGVALAVMLILLLKGFLSGMYGQIAAYLDHSTGSVVVAQEGVRNLLGATSLLPADAEARVRDAEGVSDAVPILSQFVILDLHGRKQPAYLVGFDPDRGGGPWRLADGRLPRSAYEVVLDAVLARRHDLGPGDSFTIMGQPFAVVGLSEQTTSWMASYVFVRKTDVEALLRAQGATSFLLVSATEGTSPQSLVSRLSGQAGLEVMLKSEMVVNDTRLLARVFSMPLRLMIGISFLVGTLVVGLVIYTATVERRREYGVLRAIGVRDGHLYRVVAAQALLSAGVGSAAGVTLAFAASRLIAALRPQFAVTIEAQSVLLAIGAGLGMALVAALFPARAIVSVAPAEVFRR